MRRHCLFNLLGTHSMSTQVPFRPRLLSVKKVCALLHFTRLSLKKLGREKDSGDNGPLLRKLVAKIFDAYREA
jgi:hypothetical protein